MLESKIQAKIVKHIKENYPQYFLLKVLTCNRNGYPDITLLSGGQTICLEVKQVGKKPRPLQRLIMEQLEQVGILCYVVSSVEDVKKILPGSGQIVMPV